MTEQARTLIVDETALNTEIVSPSAELGSLAGTSNALHGVIEQWRDKGGLTQARVLERVTAYYGLTEQELLGNSRQAEYAMPRTMAMYLLTYVVGCTYREISTVFGDNHATKDRVHIFGKRVVADVRLQRQRAEILNPQTPETESVSERITQKVYDFYGLKRTAVSNSSITNRFVRPRDVAAYLLREKMGLPVRAVADQLDCHYDTAVKANRKIKSEMTGNPLLSAEIRYLDRTKRITLSLNERIVASVAETTGLDRKDIMAGKTQESLRARQMAMVLLAERGHLSTREVAEFFNLLRPGSVYRARAVIAYEQQYNPTLPQQLAWVRKKIFTEKPASFVSGTSHAPKLKDVHKVLSGDQLPVIDEALVHPDIQAQVYAIVERVADFYNVAAIDIVGRTKEFTVQRARRTAILLCHHARIPTTEMGICFDNRTANPLHRIVDTANTDAKERAIYAEELKALSAGESRRDVLTETLESITQYYGISDTEFSTSEGYLPLRARAVFLALMSEHACSTQKQLGAAVSIADRQLISAMIIRSERRVVRDPRLKAELEYIKAPKTMPKPPTAEELLSSICESFNISLDQLCEPKTTYERKARRMAAYVLKNELDLPRNDIAQLVNDSIINIAKHLSRTRQEIKNKPRRIVEIDELLPPNSASLSPAGKILLLVRQHYKADLNALASKNQSPSLNRARSLVIDLLLTTTGHTIRQISELLDLTTAEVASYAQQRSLPN